MAGTCATTATSRSSCGSRSPAFTSCSSSRTALYAGPSAAALSIRGDQESDLIGEKRKISAETGYIKGLDSRDELTGLGVALSGFAAAAMSGMAGQYFTNFGLGYHGATAGLAAGLCVSGSGIVTYTRFAGTYSLL